MIHLIVSVVILLNGQPIGDVHQFEHTESPFATVKACEAAQATDGPALEAFLAERLGSRDAFRMEYRCENREAHADSAADMLQAILRSMNLAGGIGAAGR